MNQTAQDQAYLLKNLPALLKIVTEAQEHLATISANLELGQTGVLRSTLPSDNGEPRFTQQFVEHSGEFASAILEMGDNLAGLSEKVYQIMEASNSLAYGVRSELGVKDGEAANDDANALTPEERTILVFSALGVL